MNLEEELRAVLSQEADMRTVPTPDLDGIVHGGQVRLRRRNSTRIGLAAAAAALLVGGTVYGVAQLGDDDADAGIATVPTRSTDAAVPPSWETKHGEQVEAGTYRSYLGTAADGTRIDADLTIDGSNWSASNDPVAYDAQQHFAGIGVFRPNTVAAGCLAQAAPKEAATQQQALAEQLTRMPRSTVVQQPTSTTAFGLDAIHLRVRVDAACDPSVDGNAYQVADATSGARAVSFYGDDSDDVSRTVIIDFWVVDVHGTAMVVDMFRTEDAPTALVDQAAAARESIAFVTGE
jgi:hypothetical protein